MASILPNITFNQDLIAPKLHNPLAQTEKASFLNFGGAWLPLLMSSEFGEGSYEIHFYCTKTIPITHKPNNCTSPRAVNNTGTVKFADSGCTSKPAGARFDDHSSEWNLHHAQGRILLSHQ